MSIPRTSAKVVITGGAGLVGQNLAALLSVTHSLRVIDKHAENLAILRRLHPTVETVTADLAEPGSWVDAFADTEVLITLHAQISAHDDRQFERNNVLATQNVLDAALRNGVAYVVRELFRGHWQADDAYTPKTEAPELVRSSGIACCILRPTLMFGWFDFGHLGWLARLTDRVPVFPIPGNGTYRRQPLYVMDVCRIIGECIVRQTAKCNVRCRRPGRIPYVEIVRTIRDIKRKFAMATNRASSDAGLCAAPTPLRDAGPSNALYGRPVAGPGCR